MAGQSLVRQDVAGGYGGAFNEIEPVVGAGLEAELPGPGAEGGLVVRVGWPARESQSTSSV